MKGTINVYIKDGKLKYKFSLKRNITVISGNSATGKSTLIRSIERYMQTRHSRSSPVIVESEGYDVQAFNMTIFELSYKTPEAFKNSVIFIDETNDFLHSKRFADFVKESGSYFVIITRDPLYELTYSVNEIYTMNVVNGVHKLVPLYDNEDSFYLKPKSQHKPALIITEDSGSGFQFFEFVANSINIECISSKGNSNIFSKIKENLYMDVLIIADGAGFGAYIQKCASVVREYNMQLFLPECFEYLILKSGLVYDKHLQSILEHTENYVDYEKTLSWERFFHGYLVEITKGLPSQYVKRYINSYYLDEKNISSILQGSSLDFLLIRSFTNKLNPLDLFNKSQTTCGEHR